MQVTSLLIALAGLAAAAPKPGRNDCGTPYGKCYSPVHVVEERHVTPGPDPTPAPKPKDDCHKHTICIDAINECGIRYGGCVPACKPYAISKPPCPAPAPAPTPKPEDLMTAWGNDGVMTAFAPQ